MLTVLVSLLVTMAIIALFVGLVFLISKFQRLGLALIVGFVFAVMGFLAGWLAWSVSYPDPMQHTNIFPVFGIVFGLVFASTGGILTYFGVDPTTED